MSYKPMTAEEAAQLNIKPDAVYSFEVSDAKAGVSKEKKNPMIALELSFFDAEGNRFSVKDWLVHSDNRWAEKKVYDFAQAVGLGAKYAAGQMVAEDCLGRSGFAFITTQKGKPKDDGSGNFPDRNVVKYYTSKAPEKKAAPTQGAPTTTGKAASDELDTDVPF